MCNADPCTHHAPTPQADKSKPKGKPAPKRRGAGGDDDDDDDDDVRRSPDPFLDEGADEADEAWVRDRSGGASEQGQQTDAVLSCPFCFTVLTYLCQQYVRVLS